MSLVDKIEELGDVPCSLDPRSHRADCHHDDDLPFQFRAGMAAQVARDLLAEFGPEDGTQ